MDGIQDTGFETNEIDLPGMLGVSLADLRSLRSGGEGEGILWVRNGRKVFYSTPGVLALRARFGLPAADPQKKEIGGGDTGQRCVLWVLRRVRNPRILLAVESADDVRGSAGKQLRVQVRDSAKFSPGMRMDDCRHVQGDLYAFEGRAPRSRKLAFAEKKQGGSAG